MTPAEGPPSRLGDDPGGDRFASTPDPGFSQAETQAGLGPAPQPRQGAGPDPDYPVQGWDRYEFQGFLGQGGMGKVFLALDRKLGREVAIKFVRIEDERHLARFMVEARAQARVDHPHVCKVFEVGEVEGKVFITMQRIGGDSLDRCLPELSLEQKVIVLRDAALGVHEAHRVGIIHRDLKPSNIMVERAEDGSVRTFVMDFGLAREWDQDVTETGSVLGTPSYMSPEQARGEIHQLDRRTDVYSLGATLYHAVTGRPPVSGANALEILSAIGSQEIRPLRTISLDIPKDLEAITLKCLEKERSRRYASARALAEDLDRFLAGDTVLARRAGIIYRTHRRFMRHKALAITGTVATLLVLLALGVALRTRQDASRRERLAQHFTEAMGRIESRARYSALSPLHDIRPDLQEVRDEIARLQRAMASAGVLANGAGNYALGRGYLTLDDPEKAREHLQMAWDAGFREPRVAYALGDVLGRAYREKRLDAERMGDPHQREARLRDLDGTLRDRALGFLRQARGVDAPSPAYLEALMAFYEGRTDEAIARLDVLQHDLPWFYEAPLLRGTLLRLRGWDHWNGGRKAAAQSDLEGGRTAFAQAALSGRSAPSVYTALARLERDALLMERWSRGHIEGPYERGLQAVGTALAIQADHVPSLILKAALLGELAEYRTSRGEPAEAQVEQAVAVAKQALAAGPARLDAWAALGTAYYQWGSARQERNLDPTPQLSEALRVLESISTDKRDYGVENHLGLIYQTWSDDDAQRGRDPLGHLNGAIAAYQRATRMEPYQLPAWINLGTCFQQRAVRPGAPTPEADLQAALEALEQARTLNPAHVVPYFVQGKVRYHLALLQRDNGKNPGSELQRAADAYRKGLAINGTIPNLHNGLGLVLLEQARAAWEAGGDPFPLLRAAEAAYRKAMAVAPGQAYGYLNLGDLLICRARWEGAHAARKSLDEAAHILHQGLKAAPGKVELLGNLGLLAVAREEVLAREGRDDPRTRVEGEAWLAKVFQQDPRNLDAWRYAGDLRTAHARWAAKVGRARVEDFARARAAYQRALDLQPDDTSALMGLARLARDQAAWERATGQDPQPTLRQGQAYLARVLQRRPAWAEALANRGGLTLEEALSLAGASRSSRAAEARQDFADAFRLNPNLMRDWKPLAEQAARLS